MSDTRGEGAPSIRAVLLSEVLEFAGRARNCTGVTRISLVGSLATEKPNPKDADVLVIVDDEADLTALSSRLVKRTSALVGLLLLVGLVVVSLIVEMEADYAVETVVDSGTARALVLFHPSRDARFSDDLSMAFAEGLKTAGFAVQRATLTRATPGDAEGYALIGVVTNTYYWTPDLPTLRYLNRARLEGVPAVGLVGGAGSTARSQRILEEALRRTGAKVIETHSFWLWRPNDESRMAKSNREVALQLARQLGTRTGQSVLAAKREPQ